MFNPRAVCMKSIWSKDEDNKKYDMRGNYGYKKVYQRNRFYIFDVKCSFDRYGYPKY